MMRSVPTSATSSTRGSPSSRPCLRCPARLLPGLAVNRRPSLRAAAATKQVAHRTERLIDLANEFVKHWIEAAKTGPNDQVMGRLRSIADEQITVRASHLLGTKEFKGLEGLREKLSLDHSAEGIVRPARVVMCAANEEHDSVFCLIDFEGQPTEEEKSTGVEKIKHRTRGLVKFDAMLDDTVCEVTDLVERWQLGPSDSAHLALRAHAGEKGQKQAALEAALEVAGLSYFGSQQITQISAQEYQSKEALANLDRWVQARSSGEDEGKLLEQALAKHEYRLSLNHRLWDAYGALPLVCGVESEVGGVPHSCILYSEQLLDNIRETKSRNHVTCSLLDKAVCPHHNIGFTHWRVSLRPKDQPTAEPQWVQEALELHMFGNEGQIRETWMLRDPSQAEAEMLKKVMAREPALVAHA